LFSKRQLIVGFLLAIVFPYIVSNLPGIPAEYLKGALRGFSGIIGLETGLFLLCCLAIFFSRSVDKFAREIDVPETDGTWGTRLKAIGLLLVVIAGILFFWLNYWAAITLVGIWKGLVALGVSFVIEIFLYDEELHPRKPFTSRVNRALVWLRTG